MKMRGPECRGRTARTFSSCETVKVNWPVFVRIPRMTKESGHFACKADHVVFTEYSPLYARLRVTACNNHEAERLVSARLRRDGSPYDVYRDSAFFFFFRRKFFMISSRREVLRSFLSFLPFSFFFFSFFLSRHSSRPTLISHPVASAFGSFALALHPRWGLFKLAYVICALRRGNEYLCRF